MPKIIYIKPENTGKIVCDIIYRKDGKLIGFANNMFFKNIFEFQTFFLLKLFSDFPLLRYQDV